VTRFAILLRGVNVGVGGRRVQMTRWRGILEAGGCTEVSTYLNSGNALVSSTASASALAVAVRADLAAQTGVETEVMVRTAAQLAAVIERNPFREAESAPASLHVGFLAEAPDASQLAAFDPVRHLPEQVAIVDREAYIVYANGAGRSKLTPAAFTPLGSPMTARNWRTVLALAERAGG
jgi:uncharacterized protein (DUF1697 family)